MNLPQEIDFNSLMEPVALRLLGEPAQKHGYEWRYGNRGSLSIDLAKGQWFDHEANAGGGVFDLIKRQGYEQPAAWLRSEGLLTTPQVIDRSRPRIVKTYPYCDENNRLLFQVVRLEPKGFRQRRPDGRGGWIPNLHDTRRVPYLLPELMKAVAAGETIYVPEGEKDVDNLRAIGFAATTNPGGCKKWRSEYSEHLHGADVVVLPDNHLEGREHGDQVVAALRGIANRIRVLDIGKHWAECPDKGDISAWLAAGGSAEKFKALVGAQPEVPASADNAPSENKKVEDWLAAFAEKSNEALAKRAAEKANGAARPDDKAVIAALARKDRTEYDKIRGEVAGALGIRKGTLDDKVEAVRAERSSSPARSVIFPPFEPSSFPVDGNALLTSVSGRIRRHIVAVREIITAASLWIGFAWTHDAYAHSPLLLATSKEPNSGKTTLVELLKLLVPRGLSAIDMTGATLFRFIERFNPTFVLDEADTLFRENEQLRVLFNSGWTRGSGVPRINPDTFEPEVFPTFAPKIVGMKGRRLPDTTLGRAIVLEMQRKLRGEVVEDFEHLDDAELRMLRGQFARWAADNLESLRRARPAVPEGFYNRVACNWRPLLAVAELAGGDWPDLAREAAEALTGKEPDTVYAETLAALKTLFGDKERMFSEDVVRELHAIEGGPWAEWGRSGKPISQSALARLLKPIAPEQVRIGDEKKRGYQRHQFVDAFDRYLDPEAPKPPSQPVQRYKCDGIRTSATFASGTAKNDVPVGECEKPNNDGLCTAVPDGKGERGAGDLWADLGIIEPLRRCDHCGQSAIPADPLNPWDWPGRPDGIRLHGRCEEPWWQATPDKQTSR